MGPDFGVESRRVRCPWEAPSRVSKDVDMDRRASRRDVLRGAVATATAGATSALGFPAFGQTNQTARPAKLIARFSRALVVGLNANAGDPSYQSMADVPKLMRDKHGLAMEFDIHPASTLGTDLSQLEAVQLGLIDITSNTTSQFAVFDESFVFLDLPYIIGGWDTALRLFKSDLWKEQAAAFEKQVPVKVLPPVGAGGFRMLLNNKRPVLTPADFKGLKVRTTRSGLEKDLMQAWGGEAVPLPWVETYDALKQGTIDGLHTQPIWTHRFKMFEQIKYATEVRALFTVQLQVMNIKTWESLGEPFQKAFLAAAGEAADRANAKDRTQEIATKEELKKLGVELHRPERDDLTQWRTAGEKIWVTAAPHIDKRVLDAAMQLREPA
ncbi:MAG: TRAP transporter substrate-binding protein [Alphaproteobacteria bacterium]|nr:TRAP transporter substrate-binding protein [Alphaproteobacteria bacterium]